MAAPVHLDLTRETAQIRNSPLPGANFLASGFQKIQLALRDIQQNQVTQQSVQQAVQQSLVVKVVQGTIYDSLYTDNVIIAINANPTTIRFTIRPGQPKMWYVLCTAPSPPAVVTFQASIGAVLGAPSITFGQSGIVVTDGANLICGS